MPTVVVSLSRVIGNIFVSAILHRKVARQEGCVT
jgi:hypothetical protein